MALKKLKIVIWCGAAANQKALANKIVGQFNLCGIVIDRKKNLKKEPLWKKIPTVLQDRIFFKKINKAWTYLQQEYEKKFPDWPEVSKITVDSINSDEAFDYTQKKAPDLIVVSGTSLIKKKMLSLRPPIGIINLHTGLSPYIKGGPNCTNWCISTGQFEKVGNTIMWINEGIDSGNIITTECTVFNGVKNLADVQWKVMEHAHELYLKAIYYLLNHPPPHNSVLQKQITPGTLYLTRMWNFSAKKKLLANLPAFLKRGNETAGEDIITVPIKENINAV
jgi:folate-dependent phosphoribosylglycinamide formyltransferase PurN